ncbi:MAG TPA: type II secretion system protein GspG [Bacillota bacterium]|nr:type II secretion system protein GspG [Bacillota bacterium]
MESNNNLFKDQNAIKQDNVPKATDNNKNENNKKGIKRTKVWHYVLGVSIILIVIILLFLLSIMKMIYNNEQYKMAIDKIFTLRNALNSYYTDLNCYPPSFEGLKALIKQPKNSYTLKWKGPYLETIDVCKDPWGNYYHYQCPGVHNSKTYDLWTYGADNRIGGTGINQDIGNWDFFWLKDDN